MRKPLFLSLVLVSCGCSDERSPVANLAAGEIASVEALIENRPDKGADFGPFLVPADDFDRIVGLFQGGSVDHWPPKWQILGWIKLRKKTGEQITVDLFWTGDKVGAYRIGQTYYRGCSDADFMGVLADCAAKTKGK